MAHLRKHMLSSLSFLGKFGSYATSIPQANLFSRSTRRGKGHITKRNEPRGMPPAENMRAMVLFARFTCFMTTHLREA